MWKRRSSSIAILIVVVALPRITIGAQAPAPATKGSAHDHTRSPQLPRTPWGDPDLRGLWPSIDMQGTPLQRPFEFGERAVLTEEEFAGRTAQSRHEVDTGPTGPPGHWAERGTPNHQASLIVDPPDGRMPPLTLEGQRRAAMVRSTFLAEPNASGNAFADFTDFGPYNRCISRGVLASMLPTAYNMGNAIFQSSGFVAIRNEMIHEVRIIPLDGRPHIRSGLRAYMGDSRGRFEGDTLVIETTNFNGRVGLTGNGNATPVSRDFRLVERLVRLDANTLQYEATIEDPNTWTKPWKVALPLRRHPEYQMFEYACHEGNYAMQDVLSGARAAEKSAGGAAQPREAR